jgi:glycosyltransferase 2 family protein
MKKRQTLVSIVIALLLVALIYLQVRTWRHFDWAVFISKTRQADWAMVALSVVLIYIDYYLRAIRWAIFLRPVKKVSAASLTAAQFIGFTGLALLGRPGELIRPYIIARKHGLNVPSQLAVWTVERIFDTGAFGTLLLVSSFLFRDQLHSLPYFDKFVHYGIPVAFAFAAVLLTFALLLRFRTAQLARIAEKVLSRSPRLAHVASHKITTFGEGLNTIHDLASFAQLVGMSLFIWGLIAVTYWTITHAYHDPSLQMPISHVLLLMGFSVVGGVAQLPVVGGGSQIMTITALKYVFGVPPELAVSCGMLCWMVTFLSCTPTGLLLARREHVSITKLANEEEAAESALSAN